MSKTSCLTFLCTLAFLISSNLLIAQGNLDELIRERDVLLKEGKKDDAIKVNYQIGSVYWKNDDAGNSKTYFEAGISLSETIKNAELQLQGRYTYALVLMDFKLYNDALKQLKETTELVSIKNDNMLRSRILINTGICYFKTSKEKRAIKEIEEALAIVIQLQEKDLIKECYSLLSQYYAKIGDNVKSIEYQNNYQLLEQESERQAQLSEIEKQMSSVEKRMSSVQSELKRKDEALEEKDYALGQVADSLLEMSEINRERALQIELLNAEKDLTDMTLQAQEAEIKNNKLIRNSLILGVFMALTMIGIVLYSYRKNINANKKIHAQHMNITSSITYAQRIQQAMLPHDDKLKALLPESFVMFKPRDVVSGDFYWAKELETNNDGQFAIAAVDCTGHGVPGAFMSMVGMNALNSIVGKGINSAKEILSHLHKEIHSSLKQDESGNKDGMDLALCTVNLKAGELNYSGAKNPLVYIKNGELHQIRGDKHPIGGGKLNEVTFTEHTIKIEKGMTFYMYSDGYVDQFGGPENMKFMSKKFKELLLRICHLPMEDQRERLIGEFEKWKKSGKQIDDVLVLGFKI